MKNLLYSLPKHLIEKIYGYDPTFHRIHALLMIELTFRFKETVEMNYIIHNFQRRNTCFYTHLHFYMINNLPPNPLFII